MIIKTSRPVFLLDLVFLVSKHFHMISYTWHTITNQAVDFSTNWLSYSWICNFRNSIVAIYLEFCSSAGLFGHTIAVWSVNEQIVCLVFFPKYIDLCLFSDLEQFLFEEPLIRALDLSYNYGLLIFWKRLFEFCSCVPF